MTAINTPDDHARRRDFGTPCPLDERPVAVSLCVNADRICRHFRGSVTHEPGRGNVLCNWPYGADRTPLPDVFREWE